MKWIDQEGLAFPVPPPKPRKSALGTRLWETLYTDEARVRGNWESGNSKIKRDSKREETGEKLEQVTLNSNADNSARFFLGARDGVGIGIGMRIDPSIKISVGAGRTEKKTKTKTILAYHTFPWEWRVSWESWARAKKEIGGTGRLG